ncbi:MAG: TonB-dependent receptor [Massilia sp.]
MKQLALPMPSLLLLGLLAPLLPAHAQNTAMPVVVVSGEKSDPTDYRVGATAQLGPLGSASVLDTPHSIAILPATLIADQQISSLKQALNYLPLVQYQEQQGSEVLRPATRGMQGNNYQNTKMDGMTMFITGANAMEPVQQLEVLTGAPAAAYGPANPAGMFNFISKRPTTERLARAGLRYESDAIGTASVDLGGQIGQDGVLGYRINALRSEGRGYVDHSELDRKLASLALDIKPSRYFTVELNYIYHDLKQTGYPGWFTYGPAINLPEAPDPTRAGYGQSYAGVDLRNRLGSVRLTGQLDNGWRWVVGALDQSVDRNINTPVNNLSNNNGAYTSSLANGFAPHFGIDSNIAYLNGKVTTGPLRHDITIGTTGFKANTNAVTVAATPASVLLGSASIAQPVQFARPAGGLPDTSSQFRSSSAWQQGFNFSDTIGLTEQWQLKLAASNDRMSTENFNARGVLTSKYTADGWSPMPSLIFKPRVDITAYVTYASSLQQGDLGPAGSVNANQSLAPYRSHQTEAGLKWALNGLDLSLAAFRLKRPFANTDPLDNVFKITGEQVNTGLEGQAVGQLARGVTIYSGFTVLDPVLRGTGNPLTEGKQYTGMPRLRANLLLDYALPMLAGATVSANWQHIGKRPINDANTAFVDAVDIFNLGLRYASTLMARPVTWRLGIDNVADKHYWSTVGPSNIVGSGRGNMLAHLGAPRTAAASVAMDF